jgi:hypothetical protein
MKHKRSGQHLNIFVVRKLQWVAENRRRQFLSSTRSVFDGGYLIEFGEA